MPATALTATGLRLHAAGMEPTARDLAEEVPVALCYNGTTHAVMMATPADFKDFAYGFSRTEGIILTSDQLGEIVIEPHEAGVELQMWLDPDRAEAQAERRRIMAGPVGCGLCGIDSLKQVQRPLPVVTAQPNLTRQEILGATAMLRQFQPLHDQTRAVHAAGFLSATGLNHVREDVGRHNALDKTIGALLCGGIEASSGALVVTSRVSIEMVQKTAQAGCGMLGAVSAPTARAVRVAQEAGITLVTLCRDGSSDVFTHPARIVGERHVT